MNYRQCWIGNRAYQALSCLANAQRTGMRKNKEERLLKGETYERARNIITEGRQLCTDRTDGLLYNPSPALSKKIIKKTY